MSAMRMALFFSLLDVFSTLPSRYLWVTAPVRGLFNKPFGENVPETKQKFKEMGS
jgi:hypothetical protein